MHGKEVRQGNTNHFASSDTSLSGYGIPGWVLCTDKRNLLVSDVKFLPFVALLFADRICLAVCRETSQKRKVIVKIIQTSIILMYEVEGRVCEIPVKLKMCNVVLRPKRH